MHAHQGPPLPATLSTAVIHNALAADLHRDLLVLLLHQVQQPPPQVRLLLLR